MVKVKKEEDKAILSEFLSFDGKDLFIWILPLSFLFSIWEAVVTIGIMPSDLCPPPSKVFETLLFRLGSPEFIAAILRSFLNISFGILLALVAATPLAILAGLRIGFDSSVTPLLMLVGGLPDLAILPLAILWFGPETSAILMATLCAFFPIFFTVRTGVREIAPDFFQVLMIFHPGKFNELREVILPAITPHLITGLRLSLDFVWEVVLAVEIVVRVAGIGSFINISAEAGAIHDAFAGIMAIGFLSIALDRLLFGFLENRVRKWQ
ncbi:ABC transporter permease subunit [Candidatus Bathyarchaeota archaeon]|nr:ABC transporter permease subunit [Candidatus Bathyarchaeota archaeon]MBS7627413.1 ABC transporter permease subunit [Candidatus Bathyarchaeota archaeon]